MSGMNHWQAIALGHIAESNEVLKQRAIGNMPGHKCFELTLRSKVIEGLVFKTLMDDMGNVKHYVKVEAEDV